jgi:hypothetical protein
MKINVYCRNLGWLFEDLKKLIASHGAIASDSPIQNADAYICIRDSEAHLSPNPSKTLVQLHHINPVYLSGYGTISCVHPFQEAQYKKRDRDTPIFTQPIGSRDVPLSQLPERKVLGGFFREVNSRGKKNLKGSLLFKEAVDLARKRMDFDVLLIGGSLKHIADIGKYEERAAEPKDYERITALMTTSTSNGIPLSAYEALAAGRSVISTPRDWTYNFVNLYTGSTPKELSNCIVNALKNNMIVEQKPFSREEWAKRQIEEVASL